MTLIYFILILGITVFVHEFGHFICAKKSGIYVYEFSIGMGPKLFGFKRKNDETNYVIRLLPIGGYVQMAGEEIENDENIPENKRFQSKSMGKKIITVTAGVIMNFLLAIILYTIIGFVSGVPSEELYIYESSNKNIVGSKVLEINNKEVKVVDISNLYLTTDMLKGKDIVLKLEKDGKTSEVTFDATKVEKDNETSYTYDFKFSLVRTDSVLRKIFYGFIKVGTTIVQMIITLWFLITGKVSLSAMSGPVGIYSLVGEVSSLGFLPLVELLALICVNVGVINILPIPAFDGGRLLFLIIEKLRGKPASPKVENTIHAIFFALLMLLIIVITFNDLGKIFKW